MAKRSTGSSDPAEIEILLAQVRDGLDGDLTLNSLMQLCGASPFRLHREFSKTVGETPRRHVERVRLERAAYLLAVTDARVIDIALDVGFESHETFSRALRRWFGCSPTSLRKDARASQAARLERNLGFKGDGCSFTEAWFEMQSAAHMLAIRRFGPYGELNAPDVREPFFREIQDWAAARDVPLGAPRWGLFPDDPNRMSPALQCAELCIPIQTAVAGDDRVRCLELGSGLYGKIGHFGPPSTVDQAYRHLADAIRRAGLVFREGPPVQVFFAVEPEHSEIWFPVRRG